MRGGAIYGTSTMALQSSTLTGNVAGLYGGAILATSFPRPELANCVLWGNEPDQVEGNATITFSVIEGGWEGAEQAFHRRHRGTRRR